MAAALDTGRGDELDFTDYISRILPALLAAMSSTDADVVVAASNAATEIVKAVPDDTLMETLSELIKGLNSHNAETRAGASRLVEAFAKGSKANYESQVPKLLQSLLWQLNAPEELVQKAGLDALSAVLGALAKESLSTHIPFVRDVFRDISDHNKVRTISSSFLLPSSSVCPELCLP